MPNARRSGILLHPTSLPGPGGIGSLGPEAHLFLERLQGAGQSIWQVLPLGPTGFGDSPYQSFSAFAGNPLLVSPARLVDESLATADDAARLPDGAPDRVDFGAVIPAKRELLAAAHTAFRRGAAPAELGAAFDEFRAAEASWLDDYALFAAVHDEQARAWIDWPDPLAGREESALRAARERLREEIGRAEFAQFLFARHWGEVRAKAAALGIEILGDVPLFVAHDSCDVWTRREMFDLDEAGRPRVLAGAPPDDFTEDGQLWGNPLYDWDGAGKRLFRWWVERMRAALSRFDRVRLDHFRGFVGCWATPAGETTARNGRWVPVPGAKLFRALRRELGELRCVAEDLGDITPEVQALRERFGFPGMKVLQFGFGGDARTNEYAPHNLPRNCVVYPGTHDNETMQGWWLNGTFARGRPPAEVAEERARILALTGSGGEAIHWDFVRLALASVADDALVSMQDVLGLGNEARMNSPGDPESNWQWRLREEDWTEEIARRLERLVRATGRWPAAASGPA
ncbi:MAG: 4-alpha-glucanotransferase [Candidatus Eiseniibacteriota bacterium]